MLENCSNLVSLAPCFIWRFHRDSMTTQDSEAEAEQLGKSSERRSSAPAFRSQTWLKSKVLLTSEERARVLREATRAVLGPDGMPTTDLRRTEHVFPSAPPQRDPNTDNETGENWVGLPPCALLRVCCIPYMRGIPPFEILFGRPPPLLPRLGDEQRAEISNHISSPCRLYNLPAIHNLVKESRREPPSTVEPSDQGLGPGDWIWVQRHTSPNLEAHWVGPYPIILSTPSAVTVAGRSHRMHRSQSGTPRPRSSTMDCQTDRKSFGGPAGKRICWVILFLIISLAGGTFSDHAPVRYRWIVSKTTTGQVLANSTSYASPALTFNLCLLFPIEWKQP
ncbi:uncharacterized protein LOC107181041 [Panthera tigris]|uniref:uncharacterized protein LOC107181041 n=1 Tax=Panthera tigris TaxID=9694 RepID=UPI001C6F7CDC|nr:uncharacterized protein LOC107181041 [Panthera tigris]